MNICGPMAREGSSRATCWNCSRKLFVFFVISSMLAVTCCPATGVEFVFLLTASRSCNSVFNCLTTPCSAWISAIWASVFVPAAMAFLYCFCSSSSSCSSCAMTCFAYRPIPERLPSTERIPFSVLSSSSISSLTGSIPILRVLFENIQW